MSPDRDSGRLGDNDLDVDEQEESSRSIFSALWFRVLLAVLILGVIAAVAVPYVLDTSALRTSTAKSATMPPTAPATAPVAAPPAPSAATAAPAESPAATAAPAAPATPPPAAATPRAKSETPTAAPATKATTAKPAATKSAPAKPGTMVAKATEGPKASESSSKASDGPKASDSPKVSAKADKPAPKADAAPKATEPTPKAAESTKASTTKAASGSGRAYWVQVGAFKDAETAKRVATRLREAGFRVEESSTSTAGAGAAAPRASATPASADRYDVVVSGASAADVEPRLAPKGLKGETTANGVVVRPSLALREAVALSRDLADAGLSVQVRRIGGPAPAPAPAPAAAPTPAAGQTLYRVRVGGFADRAAAVEAVKQLEDKGYKPFIARGSE